MKLSAVDESFEVFLANTDESRKVHFNLRYQVYCEDKKFEEALQYPDNLEFDDYDAGDAVHFIVRDRSNGEWVAAMRLVLNDNCFLPVSTKCELNSSFNLNGQRVVEISRLCVLKKYRSVVLSKVKCKTEAIRGSDNVYQFKKNTVKNDKRHKALMLLLVRTAYQYGKHNQIYFGVALMTKPLARMLRFIGLEVNPIGSSCQFNGTRYPYKFDLAHIMSDLILMPKELKSFFVNGETYKSCALSHDASVVRSMR